MMIYQYFVLFQYPTPPGHSRLPDVLQFTKPKTISIEECRQRFRGSPALTNIYWSILCTINVKNAGACKGDSGESDYFRQII